MSSTNLAKAFRVKRNTLGFSRIELAEFLGVSVSYIKKIELGQITPGRPVAESMDEALVSLKTAKSGMTRRKALAGLNEFTDQGLVIMQTAAVSKLTLVELLEIKTGKKS